MKFIIIGMGQFGRALALNLVRGRHEVTILDNQEEKISELKDYVTYALIGDATDPRTLKLLDLSGDKLRVIVAIGESFEKNILITAQLKELGVAHIYARAVNSIHERLLILLGVEGLIRAEDIAAEQLARRFDNDSLMRHTYIDKNHALAEVRLPSDWIGKTLEEVQLRTLHHLNLLTLRRGRTNADIKDILALPEAPVLDTPTPDLVFQIDDILILFGLEIDLQNFVNEYNL